MKKMFLLLAAVWGCVMTAHGQTPLPNDPAVKVGKLDNGMTYYIRHNDKPAQRAEFYLATHVGAIQETPDQDGLAHFLEHMCFNGLKNLPGKQMLEYLQRIGAEFGRNINASTGVESTQYMLNNIPVTREGIIDTCLLVMHDYSHFVTNDPVEMDKERGVILEERRTRRNAQWRMYEQSKRYLYKGSKYAECSLIGSQENLETFKPESLVAFYETWYRPDNQALIVVGDIDPDQIEAKIKTLFADIPAPVNPTAKDVIKIPDNEEPIVGIVTDPEATSSSITVLWKDEPLPVQMNNTDVALMTDLLKDIVGNIMSERFDDITKKADAPFMDAGFGFYELCETCDATVGSLMCKDGEMLSSLQAFYTEIEKMKRYGFSEDEISRAKEEIISRYEKAATGADSRQNSEFVYPLIQHFFHNKPYMEPATALKLVKMIMPALQPAVINKVAAAAITDENLVILCEGPQKEGLNYPSEAQLVAAVEAVKGAEIAANVEEKVEKEFVNPAKLKGGKVKQEAQVVNGATEWTLSNGIKVVVLPTEYRKDQVLLNFYQDGGTSLIADEDMVSFESTVLQLWQQNRGVGKFSSSTVQKMLAGKQVYMKPYIKDITHGISGSCQPADLETALQLLYLEFTEPRFDQEEYDVAINQIRAILPNIVNNPSFVFQKAVTAAIQENKARHIVLSEEVLNQASLQTIEKNWRKLVVPAAGTKLVIVGNVDMATLRPLVEKYVGSLPKCKKARTWRPVQDRFVSGPVKDHFSIAMQTPKATVFQLYNSYDVAYSVEREVMLEAANLVLDMVYTDTLREDEGGTYGVGCQMDIEQFPENRSYILVSFDTNPSSCEKLTQLAVDGLRKLAEEGPTPEQLGRVSENLKKNISEKRITNSWWSGSIRNWYRTNEDYDACYEAAVAALSAEKIQAVLQEILASGNFAEVVMTPSEAAERE